MASDRRLRGVVLTEDRLTERFVRHLLMALGYDKRRFDFQTAPSGRGAAESWVRQRYSREAKALRAKSHQRQLCLLVVRDGDSVGVVARKAELDQELLAQGLPLRRDGERIGLPVPTWSIETWLLALLGHQDLDERTSLKQSFHREHGRDLRAALRQAVDAWMDGPPAEGEPPSLVDGRFEVARLEG